MDQESENDALLRKHLEKLREAVKTDFGENSRESDTALRLCKNKCESLGVPNDLLRSLVKDYQDALRSEYEDKLSQMFYGPDKYEELFGKYKAFNPFKWKV